MELLLQRFRDQDLFLEPRPDTLEKSLSVLRLVAEIPIDLGDVYRGRARHIAPKFQAFFSETHHPFLDAIGRFLLTNWPRGMPWQMLRGVAEISQKDPNFVLRCVDGELPDINRILKQARQFQSTMLEMLQAVDHYVAFELPCLEGIDFSRLERSCFDLLQSMRKNAMATVCDTLQGNTTDDLQTSALTWRISLCLSNPYFRSSCAMMAS
jgi:hypothetical protein